MLKWNENKKKTKGYEEENTETHSGVSRIEIEEGNQEIINISFNLLDYLTKVILILRQGVIINDSQ